MPTFTAVLFVAAILAQPPEQPVAPSPWSLINAPVTNLGAGYYRQPTINGDLVVFVSEGDLWRVPATGGVATRLTTNPGDEGNPAISPDGQTLAFTANYDGSTEVYTMPIGGGGGGVPTRRSWGATRTTFVGWTPDGKLMYSTREFATLPSAQLVKMDLKANPPLPERIPLYEADQGAMGGDGTLVFTRLPFQGSHTKRYQGGFIQQLWKWKDADTEAQPLTVNYPGTSKEAMVRGGRVYFASDRAGVTGSTSGVMNIWSMDMNGGDLKQHTMHEQYDAASPEIDPASGRIVYQHGADLWLVDPATGKDAAIAITLNSDFDQLRERFVQRPAGSISSWDVSPDGDRVVLTARGRVFTAPVKQGRFVEASHTQGVRYRSAVFMPDGKNLLALSDESGEVEMWLVPANGLGKPTQISSDGTTLRWEAIPSPDGKWIAHHDKLQRLFVTNVESKASTEVAQSKPDNFTDISWSPDSKWLLFVNPAANTNRVVHLYNLADAKITDLTTDRFDSHNPRFTPDGKWIYLLSDRNIDSVTGSPWGAMAPMPFFDARTKVYALSCKAGTKSPWQPKDELSDKKDEKKDEKKEPEKKPEPDKKDEAKKDEPAKDDKAADAKKDEPKKDDAKKDKKVPDVVINLDGIAARLIDVPVPPGNYSGLRVNDKTLFFSAGAAYEDAGPEDAGTTLKAITITNDKPEVKVVASKIRGFELSADGKKLAIRTGDALAVVDAAAAPADTGKNTVDFSGWSMSYVPMVEWRQMYADAWRLLRDYFYAGNMHGVDWPAMRVKYAPLVERVRSRDELNDVLAQLTGELSTLHHFVRGGDLRSAPAADRVGLASLGAELTRDEAGGGWKIVHLYKHDPDEPQRAGPLEKPGVELHEGDVITQINGVDTLAAPHIAALLRNTAGKQTIMHVKLANPPMAKEGEPAPAAEKDFIVTPMNPADAADLRYHEWEYTRRLAVEEAGKTTPGGLGYVHLRAMGKGNIAEWAKGFYPVFNRSGLIIDVRRNNGGNIDSWVLSTLLRKAWMFWNQHAGRADSWNMQYAFRGHICVLADSFTASDGEAFSAGFKRLGLGKVIGTRTWGGEVWLSSSNTLADGGLASAGEYGVFAPDDQGRYGWIVEGRGVVPDIEVDNLPHAAFTGKDAQLEAAIAHLQQLIKDKPVTIPPVPELPNKARK